MKCECSLNNNYQIIGLCDIETFNKKIRAFNDKAWTQIILPEKLTLPSSVLNVKSITKLYIEIKITSTKIINTPISDTSNVEGMKLTGKILLIYGYLCQKIVYIADNFRQSIHSVKFNIPFNTYIVIDENTDIENDKYCVYPCVEDVSIRVLNKRQLSKNITLFLFAHRIQPPLNINNEIIFYDFPRRQKIEVVRVSFDNNNRTLRAISTGNQYNSPNEGYTIWLELKDKTGAKSKAKGEVLRNQDGTNFVNALNNISFEEEDLIFINYQVGPNVVLTNFPTSGENYDMNFVGNRILRITKNGIVPTMLPNVISLTSINDEPVLNIGFDTFLKILLPNPPNPPAASTNPRFTNIDYFHVIVKDSSLNEKYRASIEGNQNGFQITRDLSNKDFEYGDFIELTYRERQRVSVTNNPYPTSSKYNLRGAKTIFRITETGLELANLPVQKLQNALILNNSNNQEMLRVEFDINNLQMIVKATDAIDNTFPGSVFFNIQFKQINREIRFGETAKIFEDQLDGEAFTLDQHFSISYKEEVNTNIKITNYPRQGQDYTPRRTPPLEAFVITDAGLVKVSNFQLEN